MRCFVIFRKATARIGARGWERITCELVYGQQEQINGLAWLRLKLIEVKLLIKFLYSLAEGPFQSDALLVPEGCLFDHIHNASRCWPFSRWNQTGAAACQERQMQMRSFAMLLPCGISLFSGVEFVCCPKHFKGQYLNLIIFHE